MSNPQTTRSHCSREIHAGKVQFPKTSGRDHTSLLRTAVQFGSTHSFSFSFTLKRNWKPKQTRGVWKRKLMKLRSHSAEHRFPSPVAPAASRFLAPPPAWPRTPHRCPGAHLAAPRASRRSGPADPCCCPHTSGLYHSSAAAASGAPRWLLAEARCRSRWLVHDADAAQDRRPRSTSRSGNRPPAGVCPLLFNLLAKTNDRFPGNPEVGWPHSTPLSPCD